MRYCDLGRWEGPEGEKRWRKEGGGKHGMGSRVCIGKHGGGAYRA